MRKMAVTLMIGVSWATFMGCQNKQQTVENPVERGKYLVTIMACHDCHSPKVMDPVLGPVSDTTRLLSGNPENFPYPIWMPADLQQRNAAAMTNAQFTAWSGPWGVSFPINLTPDTATGIGEWTEEAFIRAMRTGKHQGQPNGRDILPPMPWVVYRHATDEDLKAIWAYLRNIPPIKNQVPLPIPPGSSTTGSNE